MSLKTNITVTYASQLYVTLAGIVMVPLYLSHMGPEAYGLVAVFAVAQTIFQFLDAGLTLTLSREAARLSGGACTEAEFRRLLHALEAIFAAVAVTLGAAMVFGVGYVSTSWLKVQDLSLQETSTALVLMSLVVPLRWVSGLYRGVLSGLEHLVWLGGFNAAIASLRFVAVLAVFTYVGTTPTVFFGYQLAVAVVELLWLVTKTYAALPKSREKAGWQWPRKDVIRFSASIAFTNGVWIAMTQSDKVVLSKVLMLGDYGYFSLAVLVASGVSLLCSPISAAILPRLTKLNAAGADAEFLSLYKSATQFVCVLAVPLSCMLALFPRELIFAWTGDHKAAAIVAPVLTLYALAYGVQSIAAFPYYLQYAKGDLTLHVRGNLLFLFLFIPLLVLAAWRNGAIGAGQAWLVMNIGYFALWVPLVHRRFYPGLQAEWLRGLLPVIAMVAAVGIAVKAFGHLPQERFSSGAVLLLIGAGLTMTGIVASSTLRARIGQWLVARARLPQDSGTNK